MSAVPECSTYRNLIVSLLMQQRGQFPVRSRTHGDGPGKALLSTKRASNAQRGIEDRDLLSVQHDGLVWAARAVAAMLAQFRNHLG